jgi:transcriptional regulator GlxA family with amidase domain
MVRQLNPELAAAPPLPHAALVDQLGATLALIASDVGDRAEPDHLAKIQDCIRQRCSEPNLTAADVATSLKISQRNLHRILAAGNTTFLSSLLDARISVARQILISPSANELTMIDVARQAGFLSASHFERAFRKRTGQIPSDLRPPVCRAFTSGRSRQIRSTRQQ